MNPDTTNQAVMDALAKLIQAKQGGGGAKIPGGPGAPEDPRLKRPKTPKSDDDDTNGGSSGGQSDPFGDKSEHDPGEQGGEGGGEEGTFNPSDLFDDDDDDDWQDPNAPEGPQIGDRGNKEIQDAEEAERQANAYIDEAEQAAEEAEKAKEKAVENGDKKGEDAADKKKELADKLKGDAEKTAEEAEKAKEKAAENGDKRESSNKKSDDDDADRESKPGKQNGKSDNVNRKKDDEIPPAERARLERIKQSLEDLEIQRQALEETERAVLDSQQAAAERRKRKQYQEITHDPALRFLDSVKCFIRDQVAYLRTPSWKRFSKRTVEVTPLLQKGRARTYNQKIPVINVYFDHSPSWDDSDIAVGKQAIKALAQYERKGEIIINVKYFANRVHDNPEDARQEGGTSACQLILDDIKNSHCNNVIIMTDADMNWPGAFTSPVAVDGAVWFLFKGKPCTELTKYLRGKQLTKQYLLKK